MRRYLQRHKETPNDGHDRPTGSGAGLVVAAGLADRDLDVEIEVAAGEVLAVLGPNGAGKSTLLEIVAGLVRPDSGHVRLSGRTLTDTAKDVAVPPYRRGVSLLAQEAMLFPHLTARKMSRSGRAAPDWPLAPPARWHGSG